MSRIRALIQDFGADQNGATAIEYGFIATLISITIISATTQMGQSVVGFFQSVSNGFNP